jgi:hypothetical protein
MKLICSVKTDEDFYDVLRKSDEIKGTSKDSYIYSMKRITKITGKTLCESLRTPKETYAQLVANVKSRSTLNTTVSSVLAVLKHTGEKHKNKGLFEAWYEVCLPLFQEIKKVRLSNEPTDRQKDVELSWDEIGKMYEKLKRDEYGSKAHLRLSFYYLLKPRRQADYHRIRVLTKKNDKVDEGSKDTLIDLRVKEPYIEVREYKTSKWHKIWRKTLKPEHAELIRWSVENSPRLYLFEKKNGEPYDVPNSYTKDTNRILYKVWKKAVTVNSLRHAYSTHRNNDRNLSLGDRLEDAKDMGQSLETHLAYVLRNSKTEKKEKKDEKEKKEKNETPKAGPKFIVKKRGRTYVCTEIRWL